MQLACTVHSAALGASTARSSTQVLPTSQPAALSLGERLCKASCSPSQCTVGRAVAADEGWHITVRLPKGPVSREHQVRAKCSTSQVAPAPRIASNHVSDGPTRECLPIPGGGEAPPLSSPLRRLTLCTWFAAPRAPPCFCKTCAMPARDLRRAAGAEADLMRDGEPPVLFIVE